MAAASANAPNSTEPGAGRANATPPGPAGAGERGVKSIAGDAAAVLAAMAVLASLNLYCGARSMQWFSRLDHQIYDMSMVIGAAYRGYLGQRPGADFINVLPIGFYPLGDLAMRWFGVRWMALVDIAVIWKSLVLAWEFCLLRRLGVSRAWSLGIAGAVVAVSLIRPCLYHTDFTTPVAAVLITSMLSLLREAQNRPALVSLAVAAFCLALGKQNTALHLAPVAAIAAVTPGIRKPVFAALLLAAAGALLVIWDVTGSITTYVWATLSAGSTRALPRLSTLLQNLRGMGILWFSLDAGLCLLAAFPLAFPARWERPWRESALVAGAVIFSVYGMATNYSLKCPDLPPVIVAAFAPWALDAARRDKSTARAGIGWALCAVTILGGGVGLVRLTLSTDEIRFTWGLAHVPAPPGIPFFAGLNVSPRLAAIEEGLSTELEAARPARDAVFFGPALEFGYPAFGFTPPRGEPVWWHPNTSYSNKDVPGILARFEEWRPQVCFTLNDDMHTMPEPLAAWIRTHYVRRDIGGRAQAYVLPDSPAR